MKKLLQSLFVLLFLAVSANAQDRTITGTVTSQDDRLPIPGVNVKAEGRQVGTQTGSDGKFSLKVSGNVLIISSVGYVTQRVLIDGKAIVNVSLATDANLLSEVVVTGVGVATQKTKVPIEVSSL